jgi:carboxymethylenebutenolidase
MQMQDQIDSLMPQLFDENRRQFLVTKLAIGFAAAVCPITAETITTDTNGLSAGEVKIPTGDGEMPGYRAMPDKGGPFPVVLVVEEIFGVHEHIKDLCRRLAKAGYYAVAPELFARQGDVSKLENPQEIITKVVGKVPDSQVMSDLDAATAWAQKSGKGDTSRLGITGFCWGGRVVWLYAAHSSKLKAGAAWYGQIKGQVNEQRPKTVLELAGEMKAPVLGLYGGKDQGIPVEQVEQMREALKAAHKPSEIVIYPDAPHGFNADYRPSYRESDAKDAWAKMLAWFKKYGVA